MHPVDSTTNDSSTTTDDGTMVTGEQEATNTSSVNHNLLVTTPKVSWRELNHYSWLTEEQSNNTTVTDKGKCILHL